MHPKFQQASGLTEAVIGACIDVHRILGPGLIESIYERCLLRELELRGLSAVSQQLVKIEYKGLVFEEVLKFDVLVESCLLVEVKAVETVHPIHKAKLMSYMKLMDVPIRFVSGFIGSSSRIRYRSPFLFDLLCDLSDLLFPSCLRPERHGDADPVASNSWVIQPLRFRMYERFTDDARRVMQAAI